MTAQDVAREYFPNASANELEDVIWGQTGFPSFWRIPEDGDTPEECFRRQLAHARDFGPSCYGCGQWGTERHGRPLLPKGQIICRRCRKSLRAAA